MSNQKMIHLVALCAGGVSAATGCWHPGLENLALTLLLAVMLFTIGSRAGKSLWLIIGWTLVVYVTTVGFPKRAASIGLREALTVCSTLRSVLNGLLAFWLFEGAGLLTETMFHKLVRCGARGVGQTMDCDSKGQ